MGENRCLWTQVSVQEARQARFPRGFLLPLPAILLPILDTRVQAK